ncbi:MAG: flagellar motor switch protein FliG [Spirochaetia bacterium]|jgi:flagellar motor switch protein FliG
MSRPADEYRKEQRAGEKHGDPAIRGFIKETSRDTGYRKAAQFLMLLGKDEAARVLSHLSAEEVEGITREIARTQRIEENEASKILEEFGYIRETKDLIASGGIEKAKEMLLAAVGPEKAESILARVRKDMAPPPFTFLQDIDVHQAITLVREESVPVASLILAHLEPKLAARILQALSPEAQREIVPRIAKMQKVDSDVIRKAEEMLRSKVRDLGEPVTEEVNGKAALTEILRYMDPAREQAILEELEPNTANQIRKMLYTIDVIFQIPDKDLQKIMRDYADKELVLVLKGAEERVRRRLQASLSERRRELIRLEEEMGVPARKTDLDRAQQDFLEYVQLLEQKGEIVILREREEFV